MHHLLRSPQDFACFPTDGGFCRLRSTVLCALCKVGLPNLRVFAVDKKCSPKDIPEAMPPKRFCRRAIHAPGAWHLTPREPESSRCILRNTGRKNFAIGSGAFRCYERACRLASVSLGGSMSSASYSADPPALTCWKDIAHYFGKGVRTVQRWEREFGLPVRRPQGAFHNSAKSPVIADPRDLDAWLQARWALRPAKEDNEASRPASASPRASLELHLRQSRELRHKMKAMQEEHREIVRDLTLTVTSLRQICQNLIATRKPFIES
jgi:hypothetical protein